MKESVATDDAPKAAHILSQAIVSQGFIFVAGQVHVKADGSMVEDSVADKVQQIMSNISAILKAANASLDDIVKERASFRFLTLGK